MTNQQEPPAFVPPPAQYIHVNGPPLTVPAEKLQALRLLADDASVPGSTVSVSDLLNEAIDVVLDEHSTKLEALTAQAEADELARVEATHGGDAA